MAKSNGKHLVIVESPAKAKTINKYLGDDYIVKASMGHVRDLPSKGMGVDLKTFVPEYEVLESRGKVISELKKLAKESDQIYLATDLDREGEAIAWHLKEALGIPDAKAKRVIFNAITKAEIQKAFKQPDGDRHRPGERPAGPANPRPHRRLRNLPAAVAEGGQGPERRPRAERGGAAGRRARAGDRSVHPRRVLEDRRHLHRRDRCQDLHRAGQPSGSTSSPTPATASAPRVEREKWLAEHDAFAAELVELAGKKFEANNKDDARKAAELLGFVVDNERHDRRRRGQGPGRSF